MNLLIGVFGYGCGRLQVAGCNRRRLRLREMKKRNQIED
jgi:hypothetical protein